MTATLKILRDEHTALASVLRTMPLLVAATRDGGAPDFALLRDMVFYVADFPERQHHRKESELLFPKLRARAPWARDLLDRLEEEHARSEFWIRTLEHALTAWEVIGDGRRARARSDHRPRAGDRVPRAVRPHRLHRAAAAGPGSRIGAPRRPTLGA